MSFTHNLYLFSTYSHLQHVSRCHHVMVLLVTSIHIIQITQNVISIANFNLILDIEIESTEHRAHVQRLATHRLLRQESEGWGKEGRALSITKVSKSFHNISLLKRSKRLLQFILSNLARRDLTQGAFTGTCTHCSKCKVNVNKLYHCNVKKRKKNSWL